MLVLEGPFKSYRTFNFSFFGISDWGIDLNYCDIEWFALEAEIIVSFLRLHPSTAFWTLLLTTMATKGFLPTIVDTMVI